MLKLLKEMYFITIVKRKQRVVRLRKKMLIISAIYNFRTIIIVFLTSLCNS